MLSLKDSLKEALLLTGKMRELAEKDEWEEVNCLWIKQDTLLKEGFRPENSINDRAAAAGIVQKILDLNEEITAIGNNSKDRAKKELSQIHKGRDATRAYLSHSK